MPFSLEIADLQGPKTAEAPADTQQTQMTARMRQREPEWNSVPEKLGIHYSEYTAKCQAESW